MRAFFYRLFLARHYLYTSGVISVTVCFFWSKQMFSKREERIKKLERFNRSTRTSAIFTIFSKPEHPAPELETSLSEITQLKNDDDLRTVVQAFNERFTPCRIEYSLERTTTISGIQNKEIKAMAKLADELDMSHAFEMACIALDETEDSKDMLAFQDQLMNEFCERWAKEHEEAYLKKLEDLEYNEAKTSRDLERLVAIIGEANTPMWEAFWTKMNELMDNEMGPAGIASLIAQAKEASKTSLREVVESFLAMNASSPGM